MFPPKKTVVEVKYYTWNHVKDPTEQVCNQTLCQIKTSQTKEKCLTPKHHEQANKIL